MAATNCSLVDRVLGYDPEIQKLWVGAKEDPEICKEDLEAKPYYGFTGMVNADEKNIVDEIMFDTLPNEIDYLGFSVTQIHNLLKLIQILSYGMGMTVIPDKNSVEVPFILRALFYQMMMIPLSEKMKQKWTFQVAIDSMSISKFNPVLKPLICGSMDSQSTVLLLHIVIQGDHHFHSLKHLSNLLLSKDVLSCIYENQLFVLPPNNQRNRICGSIKQMANSIHLDIKIKEEDIDEIPINLKKHFINYVLMHRLISVGCMQFEVQYISISNDLSQEIFPTVHVEEIVIEQLQRDRFSMQIHCTPVTLRMKSLVSNRLTTQGTSVVALPRMTSCQLIQYHENPPPPSRLLQLSRERGLGQYIPVNEQDFRSFWKNVHGIPLPEALGGYAEVHFTNRSNVTYPACCIFSNWHIVHQTTRATAVTTIRDFSMKIKHGFGEDQVKIHSPIDQERKEAVFLPASALVASTPLSHYPQAHHPVKSRRTRDHQRNN